MSTDYMTARERHKAANRKYYLKKKRGDVSLDEKKVLLSVRIQEWMVARLQRLWAEGLVTGKYPCKNMSEATQYVLRWGFKSMIADPVLGDMMKYAEAEEKIGDISRIRKEGLKLLHRASEEVAALLSIGKKEHAYDYFCATLDALLELPPNVWAQKAVDEFKEKFPDLAKWRKMKRPSKHQFSTDPDASRLKDS